MFHTTLSSCSEFFIVVSRNIVARCSCSMQPFSSPYKCILQLLVLSPASFVVRSQQSTHARFVYNRVPSTGFVRYIVFRSDRERHVAAKAYFTIELQSATKACVTRSCLRTIEGPHLAQCVPHHRRVLCSKGLFHS